MLAQYPGPAQTMIARAAKATRDATHSGLKKDMGTHLDGIGNYWENLNGIIQTKKDNAKKVMDDIGHHLITLTNDSIQAFRSDPAIAAIKEHVKNGLANIDPKVRDEARWLNDMIDGVLDSPATQTVTIRQAQDLSKGLLDAADKAYRGGDFGRGEALKGLGRAVRDNARDVNKGGIQKYDDFLKRYVTDSEAQKAYEMGTRVLDTGLENSPEKVRLELEKMGSEAWDHWRKGVGEKLFHRIGEANGDTQVIRNLIKSDNFRERIGMAFRSPGDFEDFLAAAEQRLHATDLSNRYLNGSPTFLRQEAAKALNDAGADVSGGLAEAITNPHGLSAKAIKALIKGGGDKTLLTALGNPRANAAMGKTAQDPAELQALLKRLEDYRRISAAPKVPGKTAVVAGSAMTSRRP